MPQNVSLNVAPSLPSSSTFPHYHTNKDVSETKLPNARRQYFFALLEQTDRRSIFAWRFCVTMAAETFTIRSHDRLCFQYADMAFFIYPLT
jgi:hypothetical protein